MSRLPISISPTRSARRGLLAWLAVLLVLVAAVGPLEAAGPAGYGAVVSVIGSDPAGLDLRVTTGRPAQPEGWLAAIPPDAEPALELLPGGASQLPLAISATGWLRDQRVARLSLAAGVGPRPEASADVRLHFNRQGLAPAEPAAPDPWFDGVLAGALLNGDQGRTFRQRPAFDPAAPAAQQAWPAQSRLRLEAPAAGIYRVNGASLLAAGWPAAWLDPSHWQLSNAQGVTTLHVEDGGDGRVDPDDYLEFYAPASLSRYSPAVVFWLDWLAQATAEPDGPPQAAAARSPEAETPDHFPNQLRLEESHIYEGGLAASGDPWLWQRVSARRGTAVTARFPFPLTEPFDDGREATLALHLVSAQAPPYLIQVRLNDHLLLDYIWNPAAGPLPLLTFPEGLLLDGENQIALTLVHMGDESVQSLLVDRFDLAYSQSYAASDDRAEFRAPKRGLWRFRTTTYASADLSAYDITDPWRPRHIDQAVALPAGGGYALEFIAQASNDSLFAAASHLAIGQPAIRLVTPSADLAPGDGADWIALVPPDLAPGLAPLVTRRQDQGLRTRLVDPALVYDAYGNGGPEPEAIAAFLADAYAAWPTPAPSFLLLVGDATFDPRDFMGAGGPAGIPTRLTAIDPITGEIADESVFSAIRGDDPIPDMATGRLPVETGAELAAVVAKILAYESQPAWGPGASPQRHFLLTDNPDLAGDFYLFADAAVEQLPGHHALQEAYFGQPAYLSAAAARQATIAALNGGLLLLHYVGHGTPDAWAGERLLASEHIPLLTNAERAPPVLSLSSLNGYFISPTSRSFLENMLLAPNGGTSGYVASTGVGFILGNWLMHQGFLRQTLGRTPRMGLGVVGGKLDLYTSGPFYVQWLVSAYTLFGDPAMRLPLPAGGIYLPNVAVGSRPPVGLPLAPAGLQP